jgi:cyclase
LSFDNPDHDARETTLKTKRLIARLDVKNEALVKGIHLEGLRVLGSPGVFARHYFEDGIDELFFMDVVASLYGRNSLLDIVRHTAEQVTVPLTVGGGVRTAADVRALLNSGADKISINTAAVKNPALIAELADTFGSSTISVAIEAIRDGGGVYRAFVDNGREPTGREVIEWAQQVVELGAGEVTLTSVDREGTGRGMDLDLIDRVTRAVPVAVVAHGGVGKIGDIVDAFATAGADAVCAASIFHYDLISRLDPRDLSVRGNTSFLNSGSSKKNLAPLGVADAKAQLRMSGVQVR